MELDHELSPYLDTPFPNNFDDIDWSRREQARLGVIDQSIQQVTSSVTWVDESIGVRASGEPLRVRIYRPSSASTHSGALLFFHGGAFVFGDLGSEHSRCVQYCHEAACIVVSVDYSLAPENPFPAAFNDAVAALQWLSVNAEFLNVDPGRIAVGGVSAGGAIASGLVLYVRDTGGPALRAQLLVYPAIDSATNTPSMERFFRAEPFDGERAKRMWDLYVTFGRNQVSSYASAARASNFGNMPPTYIITADLDPLRDEALDYAIALIDAGNTVELHHFPRTFHGFDAVAPKARVSQRALSEQCVFLKNELGGAKH